MLSCAASCCQLREHVCRHRRQCNNSNSTCVHVCLAGNGCLLMAVGHHATHLTHSLTVDITQDIIWTVKRGVAGDPVICICAAGQHLLTCYCHLPCQCQRAALLILLGLLRNHKHVCPQYKCKAYTEASSGIYCLVAATHIAQQDTCRRQATLGWMLQLQQCPADTDRQQRCIVAILQRASHVF